MHFTRILITLLCWLTSSFAVMFYVGMVMVHLDPPIRASSSYWHYVMFIETIPATFAWFFLIVMNVAWIMDMKLHKAWPILASIFGSYLLLRLSYSRGVMSLSAAMSIIPLAYYLVYFHWKAEPSAQPEVSFNPKQKIG